MITHPIHSSSLLTAPTHQRGVALILALLVVAMAALAATAMIERQNIDVRRTANIIHSDQAYLYANAAEVFAKEVLKHDETLDTDDRSEPWFQPLPPTPVEGGSIGGQLRDLDAEFPINMLVDDKGKIDDTYRHILIRYLTELGVGNAEELANNIAEWVDKNDGVDKGGMEDLDYANLPKPYRTGNTEMVSLSELRLIGGMDEKGVTMARLLGQPLPQDDSLPPPVDLPPPRGEPYFNVVSKAAVKGNRIPINVNTAPYELIMSLNSSIKAEAVQAVLDHIKGDEEKGSNPYKNVGKFITDLADAAGLEKKKKPPATKSPYQQFQEDMKKIEFSVKSQFFEMTANAEIGDSRLTMKSLLQRVAAQDGSLSVATLRRGLGEY